MTSVLITGTSKGIGLESALAFGRAGYKVHATMRNPAQSPELARTAAREKLPITVSTLDVDSDESVSRAIAAIHKDHGPIDVLVNNAGIERVGLGGRAPPGGFPGGHGDQLFRGAPLHSGSGAAHAATPQRMHHQREFGGGANFQCAPDVLHGFEVGAGSVERGAGGRDEDVQCPGRHCRTRHHRYRDGAAHWRASRTIRRTGRRARFALLFEASLKNPAPPSLVAQKIVEIARERNLATPPSGGTRRRSLPAMAQWNDG